MTAVCDRELCFSVCGIDNIMDKLTIEVGRPWVDFSLLHVNPKRLVFDCTQSQLDKVIFKIYKAVLDDKPRC